MLKQLEIAGIPLSLDELTERIFVDESRVSYGKSGNVRLIEISPVLLNKALRYPEVVCTYYTNLRLSDEPEWPNDFAFDVINIPVGLLGIEYIKTHVFGTDPATGSIACVIQVFSGELTILMQRNRPKQDRFDIDTYVDEVTLVQLGAGEKVAIPSGVLYTFVNAGLVPAVFARIQAADHVVNYQTLSRECGLSYYLISKNARMELVPNPRYRGIAPVKKVKSKDLNTRSNYVPDSGKCLYDEVKSNREVFENLCK